MKAPVKMWTAQETEMAESLLAQGATNEMCLAALGRTKRCCESRMNRIKEPFGNIRAIGHYGGQGRIQIPPDVFADRNRRLMARCQMDLTALICGDPEPNRVRP